MRKFGGGTLQAAVQAAAAPASNPSPQSPPHGSEFSFVCPCWATQNFFVTTVGSGGGHTAHVTYHGRAHFEVSQEGRALLSPLEVSQRATVLASLDAEQARRASYYDQSMERAALIRQQYTPLHPEVYTLKQEWVAPELIAVVDSIREAADVASAAAASTTGRVAAAARELRARLKQRPPGVFTLPVFTRRFCELLCAELEHFNHSGMPKARPNSMNNYGFLLEELGFYPNLLNPLLDNYIRPLATLLYPECGGASLDHHRSFVVRYHPEEDVQLEYHYDDAEVTLNVNLGVEFEGGQVLFGAMRDAPSHAHHQRHAIDHVVGTGLLHRGHHMHEAVEIESGQRLNLIMWCRSRQARLAACPSCGRRASSNVASDSPAT